MRPGDSRAVRGVVRRVSRPVDSVLELFSRPRMPHHRFVLPVPPRGAPRREGVTLEPSSPSVSMPAISQEDLTRLRMTLGRLGRVLRQQTDEGLSYTLISLLLNIARSQPVSAGDLAVSEGVSPPSVTRSLHRLTELGLVMRTQDPVDRRASLITLTPAGKKEREAVLRSREVWLSEHLNRLDDDELQTLLQALPALEKLCDPALEPRFDQ